MSYHHLCEPVIGGDAAVEMNRRFDRLVTSGTDREQPELREEYAYAHPDRRIAHPRNGISLLFTTKPPLFRAVNPVDIPTAEAEYGAAPRAVNSEVKILDTCRHCCPQSSEIRPHPARAASTTAAQIVAKSSPAMT